MSTPSTLPIHERFHTWQGEGVFMGQAAFFIRTFGCPVHCTFCDSAGTWHPNWIPKHVTRMTVDQLMDEVEKAGPGFIVVTGGEPAIHDLHELCIAARLICRPVHLETSGGYNIRGTFSWITVSPKRARMPVVDSMVRANEFKLIIEKPDDIDFYVRAISPYMDGKPVWLHPEWSQRANESVLNAITSYVKLHGGAFRAGWQLHKVYRSDSLDVRAAPLVPLGGRPEQGY